MISKVFMICNAYESGVGHGFEMDGLENPHRKNTDEYEAYNIGYEQGEEQRKWMEKDKESASMHFVDVREQREKKEA